MGVRFRGSWVALVTPFRDGKIDEPALRRMVDLQVAAKTDGLVPCGTTGESVTLSPKERERVIALVVDQSHGRLPVLAGGPGADTAASVESARRAKALGAEGVLAVTPYYNKPTQEGLYRHFSAIAGAGLPVVTYNVPSRTGTDLLPETLRRLADQGVIAGIKEATGSMARLLGDPGALWRRSRPPFGRRLHHRPIHGLRGAWRDSRSPRTSSPTACGP